MSDYASSLPVRTQNNGDVVINVADGTIETQLLGIDSSGKVTVKLNDGSGNSITEGQKTSALSLPVVIASDQSTINVTNLSIGATGAADPADATLAGGAVTTSAPTYTTATMNALSLNTSGGLRVDGSGVTQPVSGTITANQGTSPWVDNLTQVGGSAIALGQTTMSASLPVAIASNQTPIPSNVYVGGTIASTTNPVPVSITTTVPGTAVQSYFTSASLAAGSSTTFTYTVAASHTFTLYRVWSSASGKIKSVVQNNGSTIFVGFNSTANPNIDMPVLIPPTIAAGNTVTVTITNDDKQAFDVYATIEGNQN